MQKEQMKQSNGYGGLLQRWGTHITEHPKRVLGLAFLAIIIFGAIAVPLAGEFRDSFNLPGAESQQAYDLLDERFPQQSGSTATIVFEADGAGGIAAAESQAEIEALLADVATLPHVVGVLSPFDAPNQISDTGSIAYATVYYDVLTNDLPVGDAEELVTATEAANSSALRVEAGGEVVALTEQEFGNTAELVGLAAAAVILLIAFGSVVAMGLPIITALLGLLIGFMGIGIVTRFMDVAVFAPAFASMIGIGVGIDYALFIVTRFREGLKNGLDKNQATIRALDTAGRAVIFAGAVVIISMLGLSVVGIPFVTALGLAAAMVVTAAVVVAIVVLPAMLALIGTKIDKWSVRKPKSASEDNGGFGLSLARKIQAKPHRFGFISTALLLLLAAPILTIDLGFPTAGSNPPSFHTRQAYDLMTEGFGPGFSSPLVLVVEDDTGVDNATLADLTAAAAAMPDVVQVDAPIINDTGDTAVVTVIPAEDSNAQSTKDLVSDLRDDIIPATVAGSSTVAYVGGPTASFLDFSTQMLSRTPYVFLVIIGLSFILLTIVFRSPIIAVKAAVMNILSIAAAFGVVVAVFQWGWGASLIGVDSGGQPIAVFMPMFLFAILFGLSMDYEVFLLSRIREFWSHGSTTSDAVAEGLAVTARVITAAAAIMVAVFISFVATPDPITKQFGLGLAVAIAIDATIVRLVLVPSTMELLGEWNWWFPSWLDRITPHVNIEGKSDLPTDVEVVPGMAD